MGATGVPDDRNLVFTDSPVLKASPCVANDLTHFVDDKPDALTYPSRLLDSEPLRPHFAPGAHAVGKRSLVKFRALLLSGRSRRV